MACECGAVLSFSRSRFKITKKISPRTPVLDTYKWVCFNCGRHERRPNVTLSYREAHLRKLKHDVHYLVDYYWLYDGYKRNQVYKRIGRVLGMPKGTLPHISKLTKYQLEKLIKVVNEGNFLQYRRAM